LNVNTPPTIDIGKDNYYPAFLWADAKMPQKLTTEIPLEFNQVAQNDGSSVEFEIKNENKDFDIYFDEQLSENGKIKVDANQSQKNINLSIVFHPDAKTGKRTLQMTTVHTDLDRINNEVPENYRLVINAKYSVGWNPLKTLLFWLIVIILAILIIIAIMRRIMNPKIRYNVRIINPVDKPVVGKNRNQARKVVMTSNRQKKQGIINYIFNGKTKYVYDDFWADDIILTAATRGVRIERSRIYTCEPHGGVLNKTDNDGIYSLINENTTQTIQLQIN
jgi:hypothetical protein